MSKETRRPYMGIPTDNSFQTIVLSLPREERGCLMEYAYQYENTGELPSIEGNIALTVAFSLWQNCIDLTRMQFEKARENGKKGADARWGNASDDAPASTSMPPYAPAYPSIPTDASNNYNGNYNGNGNELSDNDKGVSESIIPSGIYNPSRIEEDGRKRTYTEQKLFEQLYGNH